MPSQQRSGPQSQSRDGYRLHRTPGGFEHSSWQFGPEFGNPFNVAPPAAHRALQSESESDELVAVASAGGAALPASPSWPGSDGATAGPHAITPASAMPIAHRVPARQVRDIGRMVRQSRASRFRELAAGDQASVFAFRLARTHCLEYESRA